MKEPDTEVDSSIGEAVDGPGRDADANAEPNALIMQVSYRSMLE